MGFKVFDRVKEILITSVGTGDLVLSGSSPTGFQTFQNVFSDGDYTHYVIEYGNDWEVGYSRFENNTLYRDIIYDSSNNRNKINLNGKISVSVTYPAERAVYLDESLNTIASSGVNFSNSNYTLNSIDGSNIYWNNLQLAYDQEVNYVSGIAIYASGQTDNTLYSDSEDFIYVSGNASFGSGLAIENEYNAVYISGVAVYASGELDKLTNFSNVNSSINATIDDNLLFIDSSISDVNVYMPLATGNGGKQIKIKWIDGSNNVTIFPSGNETIDGQNSIQMFSVYQSTTLSSNNANWFIT